MKTIEIEEIGELLDEKWEYNNKKFKLLSSDYNEDWLELNITNWSYADGSYGSKNVGCITTTNLAELELFGLKVILNEKPKLTSKERHFVEMLEDDSFLGRQPKNGLFIVESEPSLENFGWHFTGVNNRVYFNHENFKFITWESGKAWSRSELMGLEAEE
jgi:hypothetical protein